MTRSDRPYNDHAGAPSARRPASADPSGPANRPNRNSIRLDAAVETVLPNEADSGSNTTLRLGDLSDLPTSMSLLEAARALGIGRTKAYKLVRHGQFPCPVIKIGALYRVPTAGLLRLLALTSPTPIPNPR